MAISAALLMGAGCGSDDASETPDAMPDCSQDSRGQTYTPGMVATSSDGTQLAINMALPNPPVRFDNVWTVQVLDAEARPMVASALRVVPFMPDHGHGTPEPPQPTTGTEAGEFNMGPFDLWMPGIWELNIEADHGDQTSAYSFTFCIQE